MGSSINWGALCYCNVKEIKFASQIAKIIQHFITDTLLDKIPSSILRTAMVLKSWFWPFDFSWWLKEALIQGRLWSCFCWPQIGNNSIMSIW